MYAKVKDNKLLVYPYDASAFMADNPFTNFGTYYDIYNTFPYTEVAIANGHRLVEVVIEPMPQIDNRTQKIHQTDPYLSANGWSVGWQITQKSNEEMAAEKTVRADSIRTARNNRLSACDWTQLADAPGDKTAWASYRQALRDIPLQEGFPWAITWPEEP
jgi:hypothetical protein